MDWRRLAAPGVLLAVLLLAFAFRYETEASRTASAVQIKHVRDRWTGRLWEKRYSSGAFTEEATTSAYSFWPGADPETERSRFATAWVAAVVVGGGWLALIVWPISGRSLIVRRLPRIHLRGSIRKTLLWVTFGSAGIGTAALIAFQAHRVGVTTGYSTGYEEGQKAGQAEGYGIGISVGATQERKKAQETYRTAKAKYDECVRGLARSSVLRRALDCGSEPQPPR